MPADLLGAEEEVKVPRGSIPRWVVSYGYGTRQIKNWLKTGRDAGELPPFERPEEMGAWAEKHLGKVPGRLQEAIERLTGTVEPVAAPEPMELPDVSGVAMTLETELARFRHSGAMAHALYEKALKAGEHNSANRYLEQARECSGEVRQLEKLVHAQRAEAGEWMRTGEVKQALGEFLGIVKRSLLGRGERSKGRFIEEDPGKVWREEVEGVFLELCKSGFAEGLVLE